ncbi:MAG: CRISPR-associated protein Cas2 [Bacteroidia bacterium]|nr:MAG: CRISPR-associated protein Cas2 [Bacteroidia bacterium]
MYVILVYDVAQTRVARVLRIGRRYLSWVQNSVLEGELSEVQLRELLHALGKVIDETQDSVIIFKFRQEKWVDRVVIGREKGGTDFIL